MLLQAPSLAQCRLHGCHRQHFDLSRITGFRRTPSNRSSHTTVVDTAQVLKEDTGTTSQLEREILTRSQLEQSPASSEMGSTVQVPRNKVLTTSMIAHATNKDVNQVPKAFRTLQTAPQHHLL